MLRRFILALSCVALLPLGACGFLLVDHLPPDAAPADGSMRTLDSGIDVATPDASTPDGTSADVWVSDGAVPSDLLAWLASLQAYVDGGTVSLTPDGGVVDEIVVAGDGTRTITQVDHGTTTMTVTLSPDGSAMATEDIDHDGRADYTMTRSAIGTSPTETELWDAHLNGTLSVRKTRSFTGYGTDSAMATTTVEELSPSVSGGMQVFVEVSSYAGSTHENQIMCPPDSGSDATTMPPGDGGGGGVDCDDGTTSTAATDSGDLMTLTVGAYSVSVAVGGPATCTEGEIQSFQRVLPAMLEDFRTNVGVLDPDRVSKVADALAERHWTFGCGNACAGAAGSTAPVLVEYHRETIATSFSLVAFASDGILEEVMAHELQHMAGFDHTDPQARGNDSMGHGGRDAVYSCARVGTGCRGWMPPILATTDILSSARDCATCARLDLKGVCGAIVNAPLDSSDCTIESSPGVGSPWTVCVQGSMVAEPTCCVRDTWTYCDLTPVPPEDRRVALGQLNEARCVEMCPAGYGVPMGIPQCSSAPAIAMGTECPNAHINGCPF